MKSLGAKIKSHLAEDKSELKGMMKDDKKLLSSLKLGKKGKPKVKK